MSERANNNQREAKRWLRTALPDGGPEDAFDLDDAGEAIKRADRVLEAVKRHMDLPMNAGDKR